MVNKAALDVCVSHPRCADKGDWNANAAVEWATTGKQEVYNMLHINREDVVSLSFSTYGVWAEGTFKYLQKISHALAGKNTKTAQYRRRILERVAVELACGRASLVMPGRPVGPLGE